MRALCTGSLAQLCTSCWPNGTGSGTARQACAMVLAVGLHAWRTIRVCSFSLATGEPARPRALRASKTKTDELSQLEVARQEYLSSTACMSSVFTLRMSTWRRLFTLQETSHLPATSLSNQVGQGHGKFLSAFELKSRGLVASTTNDWKFN